MYADEWDKITETKTLLPKSYFLSISIVSLCPLCYRNISCFENINVNVQFSSHYKEIDYNDTNWLIADNVIDVYPTIFSKHIPNKTFLLHVLSHHNIPDTVFMRCLFLCPESFHRNIVFGDWSSGEPLTEHTVTAVSLICLLYTSRCV